MSSLLGESTMVAPSANFDTPELFMTPHLESKQSLPTRAKKPILYSSLWQRAKAGPMANLESLSGSVIQWILIGRNRGIERLVELGVLAS
jgi:hypothetical protein